MVRACTWAVLRAATWSVVRATIWSVDRACTLAVLSAAIWAVVSRRAQARADELGRPLSVLDVGGGTGGLAVPLALAGHDVLVVDPSPDALASLRRRAGESDAAARVRAVQGDADSLAEVLGAFQAKRQQRQQGKRKIGAQPGHPRHERPAFPEEDIKNFHEYRLEACPECGNAEVTFLNQPPRVIQQMEKTRRPAAMLNIGPAGLR